MAKNRAFFFWNGKIHKVLRVNRPQNLVDAWNYIDHEVVTILYTDYRLSAGKALKHSEVAKLIRLRPNTLDGYIRNKKIPEVQRSYSLDGDRDDPHGWTRWWSEADVLGLHDYLMTVHRGAPRKDGKVTPMQHLPTRAEVVAAFNKSERVFIRTEDGAEIPLFRASRV